MTNREFNAPIPSGTGFIMYGPGGSVGTGDGAAARALLYPGGMAGEGLQRGFVSLNDFGAIGAGAEDTAAFEDALAEAAAGDLTLRPGTYIVAPFEVPAGKTLRLQPGAVLQAKAGAVGPLITVAGRLVGGTLDASAQASGDAILVEPGGAVEEITVDSAPEVGIRNLEGGARIIGCMVVDSGQNGIQVGEPSADVADVAIRDCIVSRLGFTYLTISEGGIKVHGKPSATIATIDRTEISGCKVYLPTIPVGTSFNGSESWYGTVCIETWGAARNARIFGNYTYGGNIGMSVDRTIGSAVTTNIVDEAFQHGIEFAAAVDYLATGNTIEGRDRTLNGIVADPGASSGVNGTITGNTVRDTRSKAYYAQSQAGLTVSGNGATFARGDGIYIKDSTGWAATGNRLTGGGSSNSTRGICIDQSSEGLVEANLCKAFNIAVNLLGYTAYTFQKMKIAGNVRLDCNATVTASLSNGAAVDYTTVDIDGNYPDAPADRVTVDNRFFATTSSYTIPDQFTGSINIRLATDVVATIVLPTTVVSGSRITIRKINGTGTVTFTGTVNGGTPASLTAASSTLKIEGGINSSGTAAWVTQS